MRKIDISDLLGMWFHDVNISRIAIDYVKKQVELEFSIPVGFWNSPNRFGITDGEVKGTLVLTGLLYLVIDPPDNGPCNLDYEGIEITYDGSATTESSTEKSLVDIAGLPRDLPEEAFIHWFWVNDWNSNIYVAAMGLHFEIERYSLGPMWRGPYTSVPPV